jgi:hypothetical protein
MKEWYLSWDEVVVVVVGKVVKSKAVRRGVGIIEGGTKSRSGAELVLVEAGGTKTRSRRNLGLLASDGLEALDGIVAQAAGVEGDVVLETGTRSRIGLRLGLGLSLGRCSVWAKCRRPGRGSLVNVD